MNSFFLKMKNAPPLSPDEGMAHFYEEHYQNHSNDSSLESRVDLAERLLASLSFYERIQIKSILDVGSGPQELICYLMNNYPGKVSRYQFITLDRAPIETDHLKAKDFSNVRHMKADATAIPLENESVQVVISNLAIDLMPREAFAEVARILPPNGLALFNFNPHFLRGHVTDHPLINQFCEHLRESRFLFRTRGEIECCLLDYGLQVYDCSLADGELNEWWKVDAIKIK